MKEKNYEKPTIEIIVVEETDIVTASTGEVEWWGGEND